ncbi:hypothetical protein [Aeropyrum camini]|uniref:Adenylate kinase n=1 Tax=Aeropyrum camini SY1 = JCM 12091 TaxID=1198449 RepID=U3TDQ0_9CREN|nr:hypothetical protein [Aeropyrum camini]BAN90130.1 adenylate kinase [Aeropyrum camini SY1 = JCM 12091]
MVGRASLPVAVAMLLLAVLAGSYATLYWSASQALEDLRVRLVDFDRFTLPLHSVYSCRVLYLW